MVRRCRLCAFLTSALMAGPAQPTFRSANLGFSARVAHGYRLENVRTFRLYEEPRHIVLIVTIGHNALEPATADPRAFARELRVAIRDGDDRPVPTETEGTFWRFIASAPVDRARVRLGATEPLQLAIGRTIDWELRLQRADGQRFAAGPHTIDLSLAGPFSTLRLPDGSTPRSSSSEMALTIHLGSPANDHERGSMHALAAEEAMQERRYADAAAEAQRAIDADPSSAGPYTVLGGAFLQLNRCREAAAALEKVLPIGLAGYTGIPQLLAHAYVCAGDEKNARRVLRLAGFSGAGLDREIAQMRKAVARRRGQSRRSKRRPAQL